MNKPCYVRVSNYPGDPLAQIIQHESAALASASARAMGAALPADGKGTATVFRGDASVVVNEGRPVAVFGPGRKRVIDLWA